MIRRRRPGILSIGTWPRMLRISLIAVCTSSIVLSSVQPVHSFNIRAEFNGHNLASATGIITADWIKRSDTKAINGIVWYVNQLDYEENYWGSIYQNADFRRVYADMGMEAPSLLETAPYIPAFHFDRRPTKQDSHSLSFKLGAAWVRYTIGRAGLRIRSNDVQTQKLAIVYLGMGLHAIEDLATHSNLIDLNNREFDQIVSVIFSSKVDSAHYKLPVQKALPLIAAQLGAHPASLKITAYDFNKGGGTDSQNSGTPINDPLKFTHTINSKDDPSAGGSTIPVDKNNVWKAQAKQIFGKYGEPRFQIALLLATSLVNVYLRTLYAKEYLGPKIANMRFRMLQLIRLKG